MASVGSLVVDLRGNTAQFQRDMGRANSILRQNVSSMEKSVSGLARGFGTVTKALGGLGVALSIGALTAWVRQSVEAAGGLAELSQQLGIGTKALQALQFAAVQGGVSAAELEAGIAQLTNKIGEAVAGEREAQKAFVALGVSFRNVDGSARSTEMALEDVMKALREETDATKQASAAKDLFGRSGQRLLPILASENASLAEFIRLAEDAGAVLDSEAIKKADLAADAWARFDFQVQKVSQSFAVTFVDAIANSITWLQKQKTALNETISEFERWMGVDRARVDLIMGVGGIPGSGNPLPGGHSRSGFAGFGFAGGGEPPAITKNGSTASTKAVKEYTSALQEMLESLREQVSVAGEAGLAQEQLKAQYELNAAVLEDYEAGIRDTALATDAEIASVDGAVRALYDMESARRNHLDVMRFQREEEERLVDQHEQSINTITSGLQQLGAGLINSAANFKSWREVAAEAVETVFNVLMQLAQQTAFFGLFGGGGFSTANLGGTGPGIPPIKPPGFAMGGSFTVGGAGGTDSKMVAFRATPGEMVNISKPGQGSGETTVIVNNYSSERASTREGRGSDGRKIIDVTIGQAAAKDIASRGPMSQTLESTYGLKRTGR